MDRPTDVLHVLLELDLDRFRSEVPGPALEVDDEVMIWVELPEATRATFVEEYESLVDLRERDPLVFELLLQRLVEQVESYRRVMREARGSLPE